jgi:zinc-ribbon domain
MFCPSCGKDNSSTKKFCTACGLKLQSIAEILTDEQSPNNDKTIKARSMQKALAGSFLFIFLGIIISMIGRDAFDSKLITDLGAILAILGMGLVVYTGIRNSNRSKPVQDLPANLTAAQTVELLPSTIEMPISISEHTTRELDLKFVNSNPLPAKFANNREK